MTCHEVQSKIAQIDDDSPAAEIIVHARECAACNQSLREVLWQQKWLRERFAEVSEQLLATRRRYGGPLSKNALKDLPCPHCFCRWRGRRFFWGPPLSVGGCGQVRRRVRPNPPSQNGALRANPQKDRQQTLTTAHIQSRFRRYQNSNRLDRRRRPPGRQRRGLC